MKATLKSLLFAVAVIMFCLPATAFAKPHHHHSDGAHHPAAVHHDLHHRHDHHHAPPVRAHRMSDHQFASFAARVKHLTFSSEKKEMIEAAAVSNAFSVSQVIHIMNLMDFSSDKIDVAVAMYPSVYDYNNWYQVYSALDFQMDREKLRHRVGR